jgi:uncharacterized LabA/DUF88 family protein
MPTPERTHTMAVFCDFENLAIGVREARYDKFDMGRVIERLLLKGSIVVKKAYCDWDRYREYKKAMHEAAFELIEIPHVRQSGKNSADIRLVVDALDLCYTKAHVDTFVIVSGDSDFSPLVSKLRENNKTVIGVGVKNSTGDIFISNCDEFIFYDDLVREQRRKRADGEPRAAAPRNGETAAPKPRAGKSAATPATKPAGDPEKAVELLLETIDAMLAEQGGEGSVWGSSVKQTIKRRLPQFSERFHGFRSFNALIEEAGRRGLLILQRDDKSGGYLVRPGTVAADGGGDEDGATD